MESSFIEAACLRHTELPGTSRLFADFSYDFDRVARFYRHNPHDPNSLAQVAQEAARETNYPESRRAALVSALKGQNGESDSLTRLAQPGTVAIVTGQQVGLFGGPLYTIYKALTVVRLAADLTARGIPAVPIFWLASEDHDFPEVSYVYSFDAADHPVRLQIEPPPGSTGSRPVGNLPIENPPLDELRHSLAGFPHGKEVAALVEAAYPPGVSMTQGFRALLLKILPKAGLLTLDPLDPAIRAIAAPLLAEALSAAPELKARLLERNRELTAAGYHTQVLVEPKTSLFFQLKDGERTPLRRKDSEFAALRDHAEEISPNALLRPVMQDYLLPTAGFIGGPGELAYLAQSSVIYDRLLGRMPVVLARSSFTILDARAAKLLGRYKLTVPQTLVPEDALRERIAAVLVPPTLETAFYETGREFDKQLDRLNEELERFDPTLAASLTKSRGKIKWQHNKARMKAWREILRRDARAQSDAHHLTSLLFPHRHLQERFYSILPFLAKHGLELVDQLQESVTLSCPDHRVLTI
ncbi:MAG TPA: bacillithiol biosynthesis cysteine-adding enzyme BshC [Bryobacteraceae bacterium]|jgi:bacillithiol biosynthesis cysteine-adding enzyme BshC